MKEKIRKFRLICQKIEVSKINRVNIDNCDIQFSVKYDSSLVSYLKKHKFLCTISENGFVWAERSDIKILMY